MSALFLPFGYPGYPQQVLRISRFFFGHMTMFGMKRKKLPFRSDVSLLQL